MLYSTDTAPLNDAAAFCTWLRRSPVQTLVSGRTDEELSTLFGVHQSIARAIAAMPPSADLCEVDILVMPGTQEAVLAAFSERSLYGIVRALLNRPVAPYMRLVAATTQDVLTAFEVEGRWARAERPCLVQSVQAMSTGPLVVVVGESIEPWSYAGPWTEVLRAAVREGRPVRVAASDSVARELFEHALRVYGILDIEGKPALTQSASRSDQVHFQRLLAFIECEADSVRHSDTVCREVVAGYVAVLHDCALDLEDGCLYRLVSASDGTAQVGRAVSSRLPAYLCPPPSPDSPLMVRLTWGMAVFDWLEDTLRFTDQVLA